MAKSHVLKNLPIESLVSDTAINYRLEWNYDIGSLIPLILQAGRVNNPLIVEMRPNGTALVLQGNRRLRALLAIHADPEIDAALKKSLTKVPCLVYDGLSDEERTDLILDHGGVRGLNREETVLAVWRQMAMFRTEARIGETLYSQLARFTGNESMLSSLPPSGPDRRKRITEWFRGSLGQYIMAAYGFGDFVRDQFLATHRKIDGVKWDAKKDTLEMECTRKCITELSQAKSKDEDTKAGGKGWSYEAGGEHFNAAIQKWKDITASGSSAPGENRPTVKSVKDNASTLKSVAVKTALMASIGDETAKTALPQIDARFSRMELVTEILVRNWARIADPVLRDLFRVFLSDSLPVEFETAIQPLLSPVQVVPPVAEESAPEPVAEESAPEPVAEESAPEPVAEESAPEPVAEESHHKGKGRVSKTHHARAGKGRHK